MLRPGDTIEYLADVSSPPNQKGARGQTKIIDRDIPWWTANFLLGGGKVRLFDPASPLPFDSAQDGEPVEPQLEEEETKERRTETDGRRKTNIETNQEGDPGPERPGPKGRARNRRD